MKLNANKFKQKRLLLGLSQARLAQKLGCSPASVYAWEKERAQPDEIRVDKISEQMGLGVFDFDK